MTAITCITAITCGPTPLPGADYQVVLARPETAEVGGQRTLTSLLRMVIPGRRYDLLRHRGRSRGSATETLTFLFTDLEGSTALLERLGDET